MKVKALSNLRYKDKSYIVGEIYDYKDFVGVNPRHYEIVEGATEKPAKIEGEKPKRKYTKRKKK